MSLKLDKQAMDEIFSNALTIHSIPMQLAFVIYFSIFSQFSFVYNSLHVFFKFYCRLSLFIVSCTMMMSEYQNKQWEQLFLKCETELSYNWTSFIVCERERISLGLIIMILCIYCISDLTAKLIATDKLNCTLSEQFHLKHIGLIADVRNVYTLSQTVTGSHF